MLAGILTVINSTISSSLPSGAIGFIAEYWSITTPLQLVLPISVFLIGYVAGTLVFGPLSESDGRRPIMLYIFVVYCGFTLGCALAPNWPLFLVFGLICGMMASAPIAVVGGLYSDIHRGPLTWEEQWHISWLQRPSVLSWDLSYPAFSLPLARDGHFGLVWSWPASHCHS